MRKPVLVVLEAVGYALIAGSLVHTGITLSDHVSGRHYVTMKECREEALRAVMMTDVDVHTANLAAFRNRNARRLGQPEVR